MMAHDTESYPTGIDFAWLAVDGEGHVAAFVTGGEGPLPVNLLSAGGIPDDDVEQLILELPTISAVQGSRSAKGRLSSFTAIAERGIFAYDWADVHRIQAEQSGLYELVAAPTRAITIADLPDKLAAVAMENKLPGEAFMRASSVDVCQSLRCIRPG